MLNDLKTRNETYVFIREYSTKIMWNAQLLEYNKKIVCIYRITP